jgi:L,D-transpeptidase YcbB
MRAVTSLLIAFAILLLATIGIFKHDVAHGSSFANSEAELRALLTAAPSSSAKELSWRASLLDVYRQRGFTPLWFSGARPSHQAIELASELRGAEERGLRSTDYPANLGASAAGTPVDILRVDIRLTLAAARFVSDLHDGRVQPRDVGFDLKIARPPFDVATVLSTLVTTASVTSTLDAVEPQFLHYKLLKGVLAHYRRLALQPALNALPDPGKTSVRPGGSYVGTPALRRLLVSLGDMPAGVPDSQDLQLDHDVVQAIKVFQARHGLAPDGALGRDTYHALVTPFAERVRQIELSLERWRWLPPHLEAPAIIVNIPEFRLFALYSSADIERQMLRMDVIVGKTVALTQTPVFAATMRYVVLHPYWDVPYNIVKHELLPFIQRDPSYVARNDFEIVRGQTDAAEVQPVDSQTLDALSKGALRLRQKPGPKNPLGFVKFMLPNPYNVYLHGTSAPALFGGAQRAFSHGCIRVADPMSLLGYVLRDNPEYDQRRIQELLQEPAPHRINLRTPIQVYIVYTTALAAEDGRTLFFKDIYRHDGRLQALLDARSQRMAQQLALQQANAPRELVKLGGAVGRH